MQDTRKPKMQQVIKREKKRLGKTILEETLQKTKNRSILSP